LGVVCFWGGGGVWGFRNSSIEKKEEKWSQPLQMMAGKKTERGEIKESIKNVETARGGLYTGAR